VTLDLLADHELVASVRLTGADHWHQVFLDAIPWPEEASTLALEVRGDRRSERGVVVDRISLDWE
jgi:hypothetical protein